MKRTGLYLLLFAFIVTTFFSFSCGCYFSELSGVKTHTIKRTHATASCHHQVSQSKPQQKKSCCSYCQLEKLYSLPDASLLGTFVLSNVQQHFTEIEFPHSYNFVYGIEPFEQMAGPPLLESEGLTLNYQVPLFLSISHLLI